jgi:WD40 repeat protein
LAGHAAEVWAVRFSPDGTRVATASVDGTIRLWDTRTGVTVLVLRGSSGSPVWDLAFSPDGSRLASISDSIRVWTLSIDELIEVARRNVTRSLSDAECQQYLHLDRCD